MQQDNAPGASGQYALVPKVLRQQNNWLTWKLKTNKAGKKRTKVPVFPDKKKNFSPIRDEPFPFDTVKDRTSRASGGIGFLLRHPLKIGSGYAVALDIDGCRDPKTGAIQPWADKIVHYHCLGSYTEITPSETGLRTWVKVEQLPGKKERIGKVTDETFSQAPNCDKNPEMDVYGAGTPAYVTVSGKQLPGTSADLKTIRDLEWIRERFPLAFKKRDELDGEIPKGRGKAPTYEEIHEELKHNREAQLLIGGDYDTVLKGYTGDVSASSGYWRLVQHVLLAAKGHGDVAIEFLIDETKFGEGFVESADPLRYSRDTWVAKNVIKASKHVSAGEASLEGFEPINKSEAPEEKKTSAMFHQIVEFQRRVKPVDFLVYEVLPRTGIAQIFGEPGVGKTPWAISLALHVATGAETWFGHEVDIHGPVLYIAGEDEAGVNDRITAQATQDGIDYDDETPLYVTDKPLLLDDLKTRKRAAREIKRLLDDQPPAMIVVDTLAANFGGDENDNKDVGQYIFNLKSLSHEIGGTLILMIHHSGRANKERERGASTMFAALDAQFRVDRRPDLGVEALALTSRRRKGWAKPGDIFAELHPVELRRDHKDRPQTGITLRAIEEGVLDGFDEVEEEVDTTILDILRAVHQTKNEPTSQTALAELAGVSRNTIRSRIDDLVVDLLVVVETPTATNRPTNRRKNSRYSLTPKGLALVEGSPPTESDDVLVEGEPPTATNGHQQKASISRNHL